MGANAYNNFDTDPTLYVKNLIVDKPAVAKDKVIQYSGRVSGGDLKWTFNNGTDDTSSDVNAALMTALTTYNTGLVNVQGETPAVVNTQTLTSTANNNQTVASGTAIGNIVFTWGGDATDADVPELTELNAAGISAVKDLGAKTITISGTPTTDLSFSVVTNGTSGTPVTLTGTITIGSAIPGDQIHNFTASGKTSTFYVFGTTQNMHSTPATTTYDGLTLTVRMKIESTTTITYTTTAVSTLTLVFDDAYSGNVKLNNVSYTVTNGVAIIPSIPAGTNVITKGSSSNLNLHYIKTVFGTLGLGENVQAAKLTLYPNPVTNQLYFSSLDQKINTVAIYNLAGALVKSIANEVESIDVSNLTSGSYLVKATTDQGSFTQKIIKKQTS